MSAVDAVEPALQKPGTAQCECDAHDAPCQVAYLFTFRRMWTMKSVRSSHVPNGIVHFRPHILVHVEFLLAQGALLGAPPHGCYRSLKNADTAAADATGCPRMPGPSRARRSSSRPATRTSRAPQQLLSSAECATCAVLRPQSHRR